MCMMWVQVLGSVSVWWVGLRAEHGGAELCCCSFRCHSTLAQSLPPEEVPVDRPFWGLDDAAMPLPFDLADIINRVESLLWR